jgi:hypothetical protein
LTVFGSTSAGRADFPWMRTPVNEVPACVSTPEFFVESPQAALFVAGLRIFSTGIEVRFDLRFRGGSPPQDAVDELTSLMRGHRERDDAGLHLGLRYPDGGIAENRGEGVPVEAQIRAERKSPPLMTPSGRMSAGAVTELSYWCWPIPVHGDLSIFASWPVQGLSLTQWTFTAEDLSRALRGVRFLWGAQS